MSLTVYLSVTPPRPVPVEVFEQNITHNLNVMAEAAGLYMPLWRPEEIGIKKAVELAPLLQQGLDRLRAEPEKFKALTPANGWGDYNALLTFTARYLQACLDNPLADVAVTR